MRFLRLTTREQITLGALATLAVAVVLIWHAVFALAARDELTVAFLDVGQGDAIFIEAPNGNQVLIDGGRNRLVLQELGRVMPFWDRSIDVIVATHPDADHIGGLVEVLERYAIAYVVDSGNVSDTAVARAFVQLAEEDAKRVIARRGMRIELGNDAFLRILFPDRDVAGIESNAASIVAQLVYGETEVMLTGDAPKAIEEYLVTIEEDGLESDILKVGHHGSDTSTAPAFVGFANPQFSVISAGADNQYGHPHQSVLDVLKRFETEIFSTAESGTVIFTSDGDTFARQ